MKFKIIQIIVIATLLLTVLASCKAIETDEPIKQIGIVDKTEVIEKEQKDVKAPFEIIHQEKGLKITVNKIINDDLLKIYVEYENNSGRVYDLAESLHKIVADGKQQKHDILRSLDFNENVLHELEDGVVYESVLVFDKIESNEFNLVFYVDYEPVRIKNVYVD